MLVKFKPTFLYPYPDEHCTTFLPDRTCDNIVRALEMRGWSSKTIDGLSIKFSDYGSGNFKFRYVSDIECQDIKIHFCRVIGSLTKNLNNVAGFTEIFWKEKRMSIHDDKSGSYETGFTKYDLRNGLFELPYGSTVPPINLNTILHEITEYLQKNLLDIIRMYPETGINDDFFKDNIKVNPYPTFLEPIFCFGNYRDYERVKKGLENLDWSQHYALSQGHRLVSLGIRNDGTFSEKAYDGFIWCGFGQIQPEMSIKTLNIHGFIKWEQKYVFQVLPHNDKDIFIVDEQAFIDCKREIFDQMSKGRDMLTDNEVNMCYIKRATSSSYFSRYI